jgi:flagellar biosynthesis anti-sigma factor FlgM
MKINEMKTLVVPNQDKSETASTAADQVKKSAGSVAVQPEVKGDRVELFLTNVRVDEMNASVKVPAGIRMDRVAELKSRIDAGDYKVSGKAVAEKMLVKQKEMVRILKGR